MHFLMDVNWQSKQMRYKQRSFNSFRLHNQGKYLRWLGYQIICINIHMAYKDYLYDWILNKFHTQHMGLLVV